MSAEEERIYIDENDELKTVEEYEKLLPPTTPEQDEALEISILQDGQREPIVANHKKIVLDGHRRLRVCRKHGIKPKYVKKKFANKLEEKKFIIETNLIRRQLTTFQRIEMALPLIEIERELAEKRKKAGKSLKDLDPNLEQGRTIEIVAKKIGVSHGLLGMALWLIEHAPQDELYKLRSGEKSISRLYKGGMPRYVAKLLEPPKQDYKVKINIYGNSDLAAVMIERRLLEGIIERVHALGGRPEHIVVKALEEYARKLERAVRALNPTRARAN